MGAYYITTDLSVRARFDLATLDTEFQRAGLHGGVRLYRGVWSADYSSGQCVRHPAWALDHYLRIVEGLEEEARELWERAMARRFDLGYESFSERHASRWQINASLLRRLSDVNGNLVVTVYRPDESSPFGSALTDN